MARHLHVLADILSLCFYGGVESTGLFTIADTYEIRAICGCYGFVKCKNLLGELH